MFTTVTATSTSDKIETWKGLHKPSQHQDILGMFNGDTCNNVPPDDTQPPKPTKGHPLQASLKTCMAEAKGDKQNNKSKIPQYPREHLRNAIML
eukprot:10620207-Ditylum_brightwellii.AAC.1